MLHTDHSTACVSRCNTTHDLLQVYEGEYGYALDNQLIGRFSVSSLPPDAPAGTLSLTLITTLLPLIQLRYY
jgi:hypothetical protein